MYGCRSCSANMELLAVVDKVGLYLSAMVATFGTSVADGTLSYDGFVEALSHQRQAVEGLFLTEEANKP